MRTYKEIISRHVLLHGYGITQLKILIELYGYTKISKCVEIIYRYNSLILKNNFITKKEIETKFCKVATKKTNFKNGKEITL